MAGEYQLAQKVLDEALAIAGSESGMSEETFTRALIHQVLQYDLKHRSEDDVISKLEHFVRMIEDGESAAVSRGC